jgi:carbonic anhydrase
MVVGHYGCGGVKAALEDMRFGLIDNWLRHIQDVRDKHAWALSATPEDQRVDRLCELNVVEQVVNVAQTTVVRDAWARDQVLTVHGWVYGLKDGLARDMKMSVSKPDELPSRYQAALEQIAQGGAEKTRT